MGYYYPSFVIRTGKIMASDETYTFGCTSDQSRRCLSLPPSGQCQKPDLTFSAVTVAMRACTGHVLLPIECHRDSCFIISNVLVVEARYVFFSYILPFAPLYLLRCFWSEILS